MDYSKIGQEIVNLIGGSENIQSIAHCATRLRIVLKDDSKVQKAEIEALDGVKGAFFNSGQFQVIIGQGTVNKVYAAITGENEIQEVSTEEQKKQASEKLNPLQKAARVLSNIFVPIIPVIVASGLLMGVLGLLNNFGIVDSGSGLVTLLDMFSSAAFIFLPVLIGFSAAKEFGANPYLAAALGAIMIHPNLQNAWTLGEGVSSSINVFGLNVDMIGYQGTVLPILLAVWVMAFIEKRIRKIMPNSLDLLLTPFLTIIITGFITFFVIGPLGRGIGDLISIGLLYLYNTFGVLAGVIFGGSYSSIVITGMHHSFHAVEAGLLANPEIGLNFLLPIWAVANVAQGGAAFAVYFKTKNQKLKSIALPSALSCFLGITEAAIFGVNLKLVKPFIGAAIGGAVAGGFVVLMKVGFTSIGVTGVPALAIVPDVRTMGMYAIGMVIAFVVAFAATYILGFKDVE